MVSRSRPSIMRGSAGAGQGAMVLLIRAGWDEGDIDRPRREIELNLARKAESGSPQLDKGQQSIPTSLAGSG